MLDPRFVERRLAEGVVVGFDVEAMAAAAAEAPPLFVLCDFDRRTELIAFLDALRTAAATQRLEIRILDERGGVALVSIGS